MTTDFTPLNLTIPNLTNLRVNIILQEKEEGGAIASFLEIPSYRVEAATREQAIEALKRMMEQHLAQSEIIPLDIPLSRPNSSENPWTKFSGIFKDDPDFAEIVEEIRAERLSDDESEIDPSVYLPR
jgi:predicted RNase H-like HicB family nuclease